MCLFLSVSIWCYSNDDAVCIIVSYARSFPPTAIWNSILLVPSAAALRVANNLFTLRFSFAKFFTAISVYFPSEKFFPSNNFWVFANSKCLFLLMLLGLWKQENWLWHNSMKWKKKQQKITVRHQHSFWSRRVFYSWSGGLEKIHWIVNHPWK